MDVFTINYAETHSTYVNLFCTPKIKILNALLPNSLRTLVHVALFAQKCGQNSGTTTHFE